MADLVDEIEWLQRLTQQYLCGLTATVATVKGSILAYSDSGI
jgi:hypothetical protein